MDCRFDFCFVRGECVVFQTLIASATVGAGGATSMSFTSIPQTFTDLMLVVSARSALAATVSGQYLRFNGDGANNYTWVAVFGDGSTASSAASSFGFIGNGVGASATTSVFGNAQIYIPNYTNSALKYWSSELVGENNGSTSEIRLLTGLWNNTAAINQISVNFENQGSNTVQFSTAYLYGILKGTGGATAS